MTPARDRDEDGDGDGDGRTLAGWENRVRGGPSDKAFSSDDLAGLPEPVRRYLLARPARLHRGNAGRRGVRPGTARRVTAAPSARGTGAASGWRTGAR